jgi:hypothetical protein
MTGSAPRRLAFSTAGTDSSDERGQSERQSFRRRTLRTPDSQVEMGIWAQSPADLDQCSYLLRRLV